MAWKIQANTVHPPQTPQLPLRSDDSLFPSPTEVSPIPATLGSQALPYALVVWQVAPDPTTVWFYGSEQKRGRPVYWQMGHKKLGAEGSPSGPPPRERHRNPGVHPGG